MSRELSHLHTLAFCHIDHAVQMDEKFRRYAARAFSSLGVPEPNLKSSFIHVEKEK
jgi:hypothetical protein